MRSKAAVLGNMIMRKIDFLSVESWERTGRTSKPPCPRGIEFTPESGGFLKTSGKEGF
jgi:hypothetical protein